MPDYTTPRFDHPPRPMAQRVGAILWPSFFAAATMLPVVPTATNASMARIVRLGTNCPAMAAGEPAVFDFLGMKIFVSRPRIQGLCRNPSYLYLV